VVSNAESKRPELRGLGPAIVAAAERASLGVIAMVETPEGWRRRYVNSAAADLLRADVAFLLEQPCDSMFEAGDARRVQQWRERRLKGDRSIPLLEVNVVDSGGALIPVQLATSHTRLDGRPGWVDVFTDLRAQQRAQRELDSALARFRRIVDAAPDAVVIATLDRMVYVNPALIRMLGASSARQLLDERADHWIHKDDLPAARERMFRLMAGELLPPYEIKLRRIDGKFVSAEVVDLLIEWDGEPAALAIGRDLSERKQLQAQLMQADRLTALGTLAAGVAHEINNPLAYVILNLQYLIRELPRFQGNPGHLGRLFERLGEARHGVERVSTIVRDLRTLSRTDPDRRALVNLERVLRTALRVASSHIEGRAQVIEQYEDVPPVEGSAARLEQVFLNLLVNAAQALPPESSQTNQIKLILRSAGERRVTVEVRDNGLGIPPELLDRVFDPFFTTKPTGLGTGLGLPICHSIVKSLGGEIGVESSPGDGTVFRVTLPAQPQATTLVTPTPAPLPMQPGRARVLVVDDELPLASMLQRLLEDEHEVHVTTTAHEALVLLTSGAEFDVVLCDLLMPAMSGMDLYRELKRERPGLENRMVFMTGGAFTPRAAEFLTLVSNRRIEKPFDLSQVRRLVRELTSGGTSSAARRESLSEPR